MRCVLADDLASHVPPCLPPRRSAGPCSAAVSGPRSRCEPPCERAPRSRARPPSQCRVHRCLRQRASATAPLVRSRAGVSPRPVRRSSVRRRRSASRCFLAACWVRAGPHSPAQRGCGPTRELRAPWQALRSICPARAGAWSRWRWARAPGERAGSGNIWSRRENGSSERRRRRRRRRRMRPPLSLRHHLPRPHAPCARTAAHARLGPETARTYLTRSLAKMTTKRNAAGRKLKRGR